MSLLGLESAGVMLPGLGLIDLNELHSRRHAALILAESRAGDIEALRRRIANGEKMIEEARQSGALRATLDEADLRLVQLKDDLRQKVLQFEVPAEVEDAFYSLAESLTKKELPEGSVIAVYIPGYLRLAVDVVDANEPPF